MIAKKHRFHGHNSVSKVRGGAVRTQQCSLFYAKNKQAQDYKMAIVVSKKISKIAVERNRIRRRIYEIIRTSQVFDNVAIQAVFVVHTKSLAEMPHTEIESIIIKLANKAVSNLE